MAIAASAFPRLSPSGLRVAAGEDWIVVDRSIDVGEGIGAQWRSDSAIYYGGKDGTFRQWRDGLGFSVVREQGFNAFAVAGERWIGWRAGEGLTWHDNVPWPGWHSPALSETRWAAILDIPPSKVLFAGRGDGRDGQRVAPSVERQVDGVFVRDPVLRGELLTWVEEDQHTHEMSVWGQRGHNGPIVNLTIPGNTKQGYIVPVEIDGEAWALSHDDQRVYLYPWEDTSHGYIVAYAPAHRPDGRQQPGRLVRSVWDAEHNVLGEKLIDVHSEPRVDLRQSLPVLDTTSVVDVLDYLPLGITLDGDHLYGMKVIDVVNRPQEEGGRLTVYSLAKHPDGGGEWWAYDDDWLYQLMDQAGSPIEEVISGVFTSRFAPNGDRIDANYLSPDARVMPRRIRTGMPALNVVTNLFHLANPGQQPTAWRYVNTYEVYTSWPTPHGPLPAIRLKTDPRTTRDPNGRLRGGYEYGTYCRSEDRTKWYVTWEQWRTKDDNSGDEIMLNPEDGKPLFRAFSRVANTWIAWKPSRRPANAPLLPAAQKVGMTITEPTTYPATATGNRFRAVCGPNPGEGWSSWVEWIYRRVGESAWAQQGERRNPRDDNDHTFTFAGNGDYEIGLRWSSGQTGKQRIVEVRAVPQPTPEPQPEPEPSPSQTIQIQTNDRQHFITVSGNGTATATQTSADQATVQLTLVRGNDGRFALRAPNGLVGSAQPDGTFTFDRQKDADWQPDGWEALRAERSPLGGETYVTDHGTRLRAIDQGGSEIRHDPRDVADIDETFWPSVSLVVGPGGGHVGGGPTVPVPDSVLDRIDGQLQLEPNGGFIVNGRPVLPTLCHYGDALSKWMRDRDHVRRNLDLIASAGYHGIRYWTVLDGDWWNGRHVGERFQSDYWDRHRAFLLELKARGIVAQISQGSLTRDAVPDRTTFAHRMADVLLDVGSEVCALFEGVNEARDTGEPDASRLADFVRVFKSRLPHVLGALSSYTGTEDVAILDSFSRDPADLFVVHPYRGGHNHDKTRHLMSLRYEGKPAKRIGWNGEGPGGGNRVSAIDNRDEMTGATMCGLAAMSFMMRMAYVWFSGVGVISDDGGSQTFDQMPGFFDVPKVRTFIPADVMRYSGPIFHGGETWRNQRTFAARGEVRADHVTHVDGRQVIGIYGPGDLNVPQDKPFTAVVDHRFGAEFRLVVGQAA